MKITFFGATETVTGSMTLVEMPEGPILVDAGLYQGEPEIDALNLRKTSFNPSDIRAIILTHAHLDHSGAIPKLVKGGFRGPIYCTKATAKLAAIILHDSAGIPDQDLYEDQDVTRTISLIKTLEWNHRTAILGGSFKLLPAGHILGASSVELKSEHKTVVFSGDLGRNDDPLIFPPEKCPKADLVVMESTYGGKRRTGNPEKELHSFLMELSRGAKVGIIASFAVARGQMLTTLILDFFTRHPEDAFPIFIDSPMMTEANRVYHDFADLTKMPDQLRETMEKIQVIQHERQWDSVKKKKGPLLILSSSGMMTGGRIQRHLENWQDDEKAILFLPGYQGAGTPGRAFANGERTLVHQGRSVHWKGEVIHSEAFSSHADERELMEWVSENDAAIYLIHGEQTAKETLQKNLQHLGRKVFIPSHQETFEI